MFAAIPFFGLGVYNVPLGGETVLPLDPWAILVALGFIIGLEISRNRAIKLGLDVRDVVDGAVFTVLMGFVIGHVYTVLFYFPERLETEGIWAILRVWTGFSSVGGFFGAIIGSLLFYGLIRRRNYFRFADVISFGFPFGWFLGRVGCGVVHDHIGAPTTMPWGMDFDRGLMNFVWTAGDPYPWAQGVRHELGLYEAAAMIPVMALFLWLGRKDRVPGFFTLLFFALYAPVRFGLDFLRADAADSGLSNGINVDVRYFGLTPAQYGLMVIFALCVGALLLLDYKGFKPWALDGKPDQAKRAIEADEDAADVPTDPGVSAAASVEPDAEEQPS